jgi:hypothetical protein
LSAASRFPNEAESREKAMSVSIYVIKEEKTIALFPLSNQRFIESVYVPIAEKMRLESLPLIINAAGLVVDCSNKDKVLDELFVMDSQIDEYADQKTTQYVLAANSTIRSTIIQRIADRISLYIG